ncbi:hypothetical protein ES703_49167 [subsurface metagenome]
MFRRAESIILDVAFEEGVSVDLIRSRVRTQTVVRARTRVVHRLREETKLSWREIAMVLGRSSQGVRSIVRKDNP